MANDCPPVFSLKKIEREQDGREIVVKVQFARERGDESFVMFFCCVYGIT